MEWIIVGVDPGSHHTGYSTIQFSPNNPRFRVIETGTLSSKDENAVTRIGEIYDGMVGVFRRASGLNRKVLVCVEGFFAKSMFGADLPPKMMGAIIVAYKEALKAEARYYKEYNKRSINKAVTGYGGSKKKKITKKIIQSALKEAVVLPPEMSEEDMTEHSWDAIAVAITGMKLYDFKDKETDGESA